MLGRDFRSSNPHGFPSKLHVPNRLSREFRFLAETRNLAAIDCLDSLLDSPDAELRKQAAIALSLRKEPESIDRIIGSFSRTTPIDRRGWHGVTFRVLPELLRILEDTRHRCFRGALKLIGHCEVVEALPRLVYAAEQTSSAHGAFAGKILLDTASRLGAEARAGAHSPAREALIRLLTGSLNEFAAHRSNVIAEALLAGAVPDDAGLQAILTDSNDRTLKILVRQWKTTQREEALDLLVRLFGRNFLPRSVVDILCRERKDTMIAKALARGTEDGISSAVANRLQQNGGLACFEMVEDANSDLEVHDRRQLWKMMAASKIPIPKLFEGIDAILQDQSPEAQHAVVDMLRHYRSPKCREVLKAMAPAIAWDDVEPAAEAIDALIEQGVQFRRRLRTLTQFRDTGTEGLRVAIGEFFQDFTIHAFIESLDVLSDDALACFADILPLVNQRWHEALLPMLQSPAPKERCKAAIVAGYLPPQPNLRGALLNLTNDKFQMIQEEAEFALAKYNAKLDASPPAPVMGDSVVASMVSL